jgi:uridylate kinase
MKYDDAVFFKEISYDDVIKKDLRFMDQTAISLARE